MLYYKHTKQQNANSQPLKIILIILEKGVDKQCEVCYTKGTNKATVNLDKLMSVPA